MLLTGASGTGKELVARTRHALSSRRGKPPATGVRFYGTAGTAAFMADNGVPVTPVHWPLDGESPTAVDLIRSGDLDLVVNIPKDATEEELKNDYMIRRAAVDCGVPLITNLQLAQGLVQALCRRSLEDLEIRSWQEY